MAKKLLNEKQIRRFQELAGMEAQPLNEGMVSGAIEGAAKVASAIPKAVGMKRDKHEDDKGEANMMSYGRDKDDKGEAHMAHAYERDDEMDGDLELDDRDVDALRDAIEVIEKIVDAAGGEEEEDEEEEPTEDEEEEPTEDEGEEMPEMPEGDEAEAMEDMEEEDEDKPMMEGLSPAAKKLLSDPKILREVARRVAKRLS